MNLRALEILRTLIEAETTVSAAQILGVSQPAVSNAIRQLESSIGFKLFRRVGNRLVPRVEAMVLYKSAEPLFVQMEVLREIASNLKDNRLGHVRVFATPQLGNSALPSAVQRFLVDRPKVRLTANVLSSDRVIEAVATGLADFGLLTGLESTFDDIFTVVKFTTVEMVCVVPVDHKIAELDIVSLSDLQNLPLVGLDSSARLRKTVLQAYVEANEAYNPLVETLYCDTACRMVEAGIGVAIVDWLSAIPHLKMRKLKVLGLRPRLELGACAILRKQKQVSRLSEVLLEELRKSIQQLLIEFPMP